MFRNRANSQKPNEELLETFRATFPHLASTSRSHSIGNVQASSLTDALDVAHTARNTGDHEDIKDADPTPRGTNEPWRFTPSLLDPNSFAFTTFASQPPGYYTPTPGGTNTLYHSQAGDLHTPGFSFGLGTPLSLPTSEGGLHAGQTASTTQLHGFNPHALGNHHHFSNQNPFAMQAQHAPAFAPHQFTHQPSVFEQHAPLTQTHENSPMDNIVPDVEMQEQSPLIGYAPQTFEDHVPAPAPAAPLPGENFRYHVTLNAPTAMIKQADEIPVTYLNKGQAYTISLVDTQAVQNSSTPVKYRTFIRISFEDEHQRLRPASCWQLWKEGRGTNEAHQRGGRLQAVEFVDPSQAGGGDMQGRPKIELDTASFDGFAVTWSPVHNTAPECSLAVRFNFLSTDFSHSKGVKGIPVRLCAKTELVTNAPGSPESGKQNELCYCKVKLFRDHGAERKLSNDVAHVKKTIDKLKQQIAQVESGMKDFGKRKRSGSITKGASSQRPGKVQKHKRTWSMSSNSESGGRPAAEEDLHLKLASLQDMFSSTRPVSVLYLKGEDSDDPDLHPVQLTGSPPNLQRIDTNVSTDTQMWERQSPRTGATSSVVSPTASHQSLHSENRRGSTFKLPTPFPSSRMSSNEWRNLPQTATGDLRPHGITAGSDVPTKVQRPYGDDHALSGWIEALGVDQTYQPPPEPIIKPVACFFVQPRIAGKQPDDNYFRAVYLMDRTLKELIAGIARKINIEPTQVTRTIRVNQKGLQILLDDSGVQAIPEQQDMAAEFQAIIPPTQPVKREWDAGPTDIQVDGDIHVIENVNSTGYELRLLY